MLSLKSASNVRSYSFKIEDAVADAVAIGGTDYFGGIIFDKATTENPAFDFAVSSVEVYSVPNASGVTTKRVVGDVVFVNETGYIGVAITSATADDVITFVGSFLAPTATSKDEFNDIGSVVGGATPDLVNLGYSNDITFDSSQEPVYLQ